MYQIYWLISESKNKTYIGFTNNIKQRIIYHRSGKVKSTKDFGRFRCFVLEKSSSLNEVIKREKYWKSCAGRKKLKKFFNKIYLPGSYSG